ncbi:SDR family NAD(P)-dependent oxidoreductase [Acidithiobacillus sp. M4-SHS-6]|uniref:SDR family NAD(P)-dependent oxidoreductase n=1 Tax=Acidithiobacillus sp. M4-SHS-6 TaxID=3383024 RepID=UPI0039BE51AA
MYLEKYDLKGRNSVVTGGGRGIGLACSTALAEAGAHVVIADCDADIGEEGKAALAKLGHSADAVVVDVTDSDAVNDLATSLNERFGSIDILVNSAGIARSGTAAEDVTDEHWLDVLNVNLNGTFYCARAFGRAMLARRNGAIVNIGSMSGFISNKPQKQSYYNASKAAVHHLTRSLAGEWADRGVRVNAVAPTYIDTPLTRFGMEDEELNRIWLDMTPMHRVGQPHEIASVVLFLASDAASLMTGSIVLADGGYTVW